MSTARTRERVKIDPLDDRELQAQLVTVLNQLQALNERARCAVLDGDRDRLADVGTRIGDCAASLVTLARP
jgi:hypothetical protein